MTRLALLAALVWLASWPGPSAAVAEPVRFRSGEHPGFSRLVLTLPPGVDWQLGRGAEGYLLRIDPAPDGFDPAGIFDRIPRARLRDVMPTAAGELQLALACDCHARAFLWRPERLVIDIVDGPPTDRRFEQRFDSVSATPLLPPVLSAAATPMPPGLPFDAGPSPMQAERLARVQQDIVDGIARAATQGLLTPVTKAAPPAIAEPAADPTPIVATAETMPSAAPPAPALVTDPKVPGLHLETSIDRDAPAIPNPRQLTEDGGACLSDAELDIASWVDDTGFVAQLGARRRALVADLDRVDPAALTALARTYVAFGFGAEADAALRQGATRSRRHDILAALAAVVDGRPPPTAILADQTGCPGDIAFWSLIAAGGRIGGRTIDAALVQRVHRALPALLQAQLAPRLADALRVAGLPGPAADVLGRSSPAAGPAMVSAEAALAADTGTPDSAIRRLTEMARTDSTLPPADLSRLFDLLLQTGEPIDPGLVGLADTLRFQNRGTAEAARLAAAEAPLLARLGRYADALALLNDAATPLPDSFARRTRSTVVIEMTRAADDATFLRQSLPGLPGPVDSATQNLVAARLIDLGFGAAARPLLQDEADRSAMVERRRLRALIDGQATGKGATVPGADPVAIGGAAWLAGDWARLAKSDDPLLSQAGRAMLDRATPTTPTPPSLALGQDALAQADQTRALVTSLLSRFAPPASGTAPGL
ncbi:MAG: hypothetical protein GC146_09005 [Limimaricola sp.]|uniref:hypothetical protein n=1 Tax=Limimaricola sp. TaxID=2211665 RepID=UPI001DB61F6F|nr:hypothetical protein [Limimaricola sp.]MBI1417347.1 hypothetical protein [Limimaricola sp.]